MTQKVEYLSPNERMSGIRLYQKFCADAGYRGTFVSDLKMQFDFDVDISEKIKPHQWEILPRRWVVERTPSWFDHSRRLSKDHEISVSSAHYSSAYEYRF